MDPRRRFTATAGDYARWRPGYPEALADWVVAAAGLEPGARIVDVGCGTGISARLFAARGLAVTGVDPNPAMLAWARARAHADPPVQLRPRYRRGEAEATGLSARCADLVTAAQALHWFDLPRALEEFRRILRPGGACAAFWNVRALSGPFAHGYEELLDRYSAEYRELKRAEDSARVLRRLRRSGGLSGLKGAVFRNAQRLDLEGFLGRVRSSSYVAHGIRARDRAPFEAALRRLFKRHGSGGGVVLPYRCVAWLWRFETR